MEDSEVAGGAVCAVQGELVQGDCFATQAAHWVGILRGFFFNVCCPDIEGRKQAISKQAGWGWGSEASLAFVA